MRRAFSIQLAACAFIAAAAACKKDEPGIGPGPAPPSCGGDQVACGHACVSLASDPLNCGGCGIPCSNGRECAGGACQCQSGTLCNGSCLPVDGSDCPGTPGNLPALITSAPGAYWKTDGALAVIADAAPDVTVDDSATAQTWEGFGGAFNELGWSYLSMLSDEDRDIALRLLYGADGARFAFGRIPIGASDYATDRYTLDETPGDTALADFSLDRDAQKLIPFVKAAQAIKPDVRLWASPWTPPTWMKQGPFQPGNLMSPFDGGSMKDDDATMAAFAHYLAEFVTAYLAQGIAIETISPQNEPSYVGNYPTCAWSPATYARFVGQYLGPALAAASPNTRIMLGTFNGGSSDVGIINAVMSDAAASPYIGVLGFQWGMRDKVAATRSFNLPVWQTEHQCGNYPWQKPFDASVAPNDQAYAVETWHLIHDWIRAGASAYGAWNMVLDAAGVGIDTTRVWPQNALLTVDTSSRTLTVTPAYYVFRHLSQFVAPGAKLVATSGGDALAFKNPDGTIVLVVYNAGAAREMTVGAAGRQLRFAMPGDGWATVLAR